VASGFQESVAIDGLTNPTSLRFAADGRVFIAEKSGLILVYSSLTATTPAVFADLRTEVDDYWDRGLLSIELHPNFPTTPYVYAYFAYDAPIGGTAPKWHDACPTPPGPTTDGCVISGRLVRLTADATGNHMVPGSEKVLIKDNWCQQFPSHSNDDLRFGPDGALYLTAGDGGSFTHVDYGQDGGTYAGDKRNPCGDPPAGVGGFETSPTAEGGALRAQSFRRPSTQTAVLNGAILRIDPNTGDGFHDNPNHASPDIKRRRIDAYGLRNPFRFTFRPGTNEVWIGDVGYGTWEEIDRITSPTAASRNFGWPCYEGNNPQGSYQNAGLNLCTSLSSSAVTKPYYTYQHGAHVVSSENCTFGSSSISGLAFYQGSGYPAAYHGALFFSDYSRNCIWAMPKGSNGLPDSSKIKVVIGHAGHPVDLELGPKGDVFYADLNDGEIRRIQGNGPNAVATATPDHGLAPLQVQFDGTQSTDPNPSVSLSYAWDLDGDGNFNDATGPTTSFTYQTEGRVAVRLQVTDSLGLSSVSSPVIVQVGPPPQPVIDSPTSSLTWKVGDQIDFSGSAKDGRDNPLPASALSWTILLHHCVGGTTDCHIHIVQTIDGVASGTFAAPDHEYPSYLELQLTATDPVNGLQGTASVRLDPQTVRLTFQSTPVGVSLSVDGFTGTAPFTYDVIVGSTNTISGPAQQVFGDGTYVFTSWSDGGAQSHSITVGDTPATYTALYSGTGSDTWYFAEGYTGKGFDEWLTLANAGGTTANVTVRYLIQGSSTPLVKSYTVHPKTRTTVKVNDEIGSTKSVSMAIQSSQPIIAERPMYILYGLGSATVPGGTSLLGATSLQQDYYFGYVDTTANHDTWFTILNQNSTTLNVTFDYYAKDTGAKTEIQHSVAPNSRGSFKVNDEVGLPAGTYSAHIHFEDGLSAFVERPMYFKDSMTGRPGITDVLGVAVPQTSWYFAEGQTDSTHRELFILANPSETDTATAHAVFYGADGSDPSSSDIVIQPGHQVILDASTVAGLGTATHGAAFTADQGILVDRYLSQRFVGPLGTSTSNSTVDGATDGTGTSALGQAYYFAEGYTGGKSAEYLELANPDATHDATVTVSFLPSNGSATVVRTYTVPAHSRFTLTTSTVMKGTSFSMAVIAERPIVAERTMEFIYGMKTGTTTTNVPGANVAVGYQP
jgi:glucose/arabinose dehydrogenase